MPVIIAPIILGISVSVSVGIALGTKWNQFKIWLAKLLNNYHIHGIDKRDNESKITISFIMLTKFIHLMIKDQNASTFSKKILISIRKDNKSIEYSTIPALSHLQINIDISNERKNELKLKENKLAFWILASGVDGQSPTGYEIWSKDSSHVSDIYSVLTLFFRNETRNSNCNDLINFMENFRIMNPRIQTETFREISNNTRNYIRQGFTKKMKHLNTNDDNFSVIKIDQCDNNSLTIKERRIHQLDNLARYMNTVASGLNSDDLKFVACVRNRNIFLGKEINEVVELENTMSFIQQKFGTNAKHVNCMIILSNFKTFLRMRHEQVNQGVDYNIKGINRIKLFDESFRDIVTDTNQRFREYPFISHIMLIMYLEYTILRNENKFQFNENLMDDVINTLEDPIDILLGNDENHGLDQLVESNSENLPPPNSGMIVDHTKNFSEFKLPNTLNKETAPLLTKRTPRSN